MTIPPEAEKSPQTVTPSGERIEKLIDGVEIFRPNTHQDERGSLCEIYHPEWNFDNLAIPGAYLVTINPGWVKGWAIHQFQVDRYFFSHGQMKLVLFDARPESPTYELINELYFGEINRALVSVPAGIFHAIENTGINEAILFNIPDKAYIHECPDKYTLSVDNDLIPYDFKHAKHY